MSKHWRQGLRAAGRALVLPVLLAAAQAAHAGEVVPVRFIDGLPVVQVQLGAIRADFLLDTGGQIALTVPAPLINGATGVTLGTGQRQMGDAAGNVHTVQTLVARSVRLGNAELGPLEGLVNYKWGLNIGNGEAPDVTRKGVIGLGALSSRALLLDLSAGRLVLFEHSAQDRPDLAGWQRVPFTYDKAGIVVQLGLPQATATMALDTAATVSLLNKRAALFTTLRSPCRGMPPSAQFCGMQRFKQVLAGGGDIGALDTAVVEMRGVPFDGLLGIDFFLQRRVFIDFEARALFLQAATHPGRARGHRAP